MTTVPMEIRVTIIGSVDKPTMLILRLVSQGWNLAVVKANDDHLPLLDSIASGNIVSAVHKLRERRHVRRRDIARAIRIAQKYGLTKWYLENMSSKDRHKFKHEEWLSPLFWTITQSKLHIITLFAHYGYYHSECTLAFIAEHDLLDINPPVWNMIDCIHALVYSIAHDDRNHWRDILLQKIVAKNECIVTTMQFTSVFDACPEIAMVIAPYLGDVDAWILYKMTNDSSGYFSPDDWANLEPIIMPKVARQEAIDRECENRRKSLFRRMIGFVEK